MPDDPFSRASANFTMIVVMQPCLCISCKCKDPSGILIVLLPDRAQRMAELLANKWQQAAVRGGKGARNCETVGSPHTSQSTLRTLTIYSGLCGMAAFGLLL